MDSDPSTNKNMSIFFRSIKKKDNETLFVNVSDSPAASMRVTDPSWIHPWGERNERNSFGWKR
jgi:hypothetical protein